MDTYRIEPGETIRPRIKNEFYLAQAMVSIKAVVLNTQESKTFDFKIRFKENLATGPTAEFHMNLSPPYFFEAGTFNTATMANLHHGPYRIIEIESSKENPPLIIQFGFSDKLA